MTRRYSRLLIPSQPLQVLPELAVAIGLNEALVLQQVHYWLDPDRNGGRVVDGVKWVYNTYEGWHQNFPFWSVRTIKRTISSLEQSDLLESRDDLNEHASDRTKWYTINYDHPILMEKMAVAPPSGQNGTPIVTDWNAPSGQNGTLFIGTETTAETTPEQWEEMFGKFWASYPKKMDKGHARKTWAKVGEKFGRSDEFLSRILASIKAHKASKDWTKDNGQFIPYPATWLNGEGWDNVVNGVGPTKPESEMTELDHLRIEYKAYKDDPLRNYGSMTRVRELSAMKRRIEELEAEETVS